MAQTVTVLRQDARELIARQSGENIMLLLTDEKAETVNTIFLTRVQWDQLVSDMS